MNEKNGTWTKTDKIMKGKDKLEYEEQKKEQSKGNREARRVKEQVGERVRE